LFSLLGWATLSINFIVVRRFDNYDPNSNLDSDGNSFFMAGLEYSPAKNVSVIPNFQYVNYQAKDIQRNSKSDLVARLILHIHFNVSLNIIIEVCNHHVVISRQIERMTDHKTDIEENLMF